MKAWTRSEVIEKVISDARDGIADAEKVGIEVFPIRTIPDGFEITTRFSRNPRYSGNGGDYYFWTKYTITSGQLVITDCCSCDFWQPNNSIGIVCQMTPDELDCIMRTVRESI